jgi:hypothetical protein
MEREWKNLEFWCHLNKASGKHFIRVRSPSHIHASVSLTSPSRQVARPCHCLHASRQHKCFTLLLHWHKTQSINRWCWPIEQSSASTGSNYSAYRCLINEARWAWSESNLGSRNHHTHRHEDEVHLIFNSCLSFIQNDGKCDDDTGSG